MTDEPIETDDFGLDKLLAANWPAMVRRAAARATARIVWERRLQRVNLCLAAAVVLLCFQTGASLVALARLQSAAHSASELVWQELT